VDLTQRIGLLEKAALFALLQAECLAGVAVALEEECHPEAHVIYEPGDPADFLYLVSEGQVRLEFAGGRGFEVGAGQSFGFEEVLSGGARVHSARSVGACRLLRLDQTRARQLAIDDPGLAQGAIRVLLAREGGQPAANVVPLH
jgi:CRP-like cAMP-binding protein